MKPSEKSSSDSSPPGIDECPLCKQPIEVHDPRNWKEVTGWVGGPKKDSMRLRQDTGRVAHDDCVQKLQAGQAVDQPDIFEEVESGDVEPPKYDIPF